MDFFRSILSDDPGPEESEKSHDSGSNSVTSPLHLRQDDEVEDDSDQNFSLENEPNSKLETNSIEGGDGGGGGWSFGGLMKTLATRSESVIETYRRDFQEFGSGLRKETDLFREVATRAVKELPNSIEVGASVAHGSIETVGHAIDSVLKSTAEIVSHGKETLLQPSDNESDTPDTVRNLDLKRYNRYDAQLRTIQSDENTYCKEPEEVEDYMKWKRGFVLEEKAEEVESLIAEGAAIEEIYKRLVPNSVDRETFWCRYFYRVHKLKQQESVRANLVKRAISVDDEEELSWDVDDEDDEESNRAAKVNVNERKESGGEGFPITSEESPGKMLQSGGSAVFDENEENKASVDSSVHIVADEKARPEETSEMKNVESVVKSDEKGDSEDKKVNHGESSKDSNVTVAPIQQKSLPEEDDLGWDEIEDLGSDDIVKKPTQTWSSNKVDVRKPLNNAEEYEDLSWDIEDDDDEPVKAC